MRKLNLAGNRFGKLVCRSEIGISGSHVLWECICDCGKITNVTSGRLRSGNTKSCGCLLVESTGLRFRKHGMKHTKEYRAWLHIRQRCYNPNVIEWSNYGGRGTTMCKRWNSFNNFLKDVGMAPTENHSIDRINNNGNYEPANVKWSTRREQNSNRRNNVFITVNGKTNTLQYWSDLYSIDRKTLHYRLKSGWPINMIFTKPVLGNRVKKYI